MKIKNPGEKTSNLDFGEWIEGRNGLPLKKGVKIRIDENTTKFPPTQRPGREWIFKKNKGYRRK